jgi:hypothetical protein
MLHICWIHPQGLIKAELDGCDGGRPVYLMGESFGGLLVMALAIKLEAYIDRYADAVVGRLKPQYRVSLLQRAGSRSQASGRRKLQEQFDAHQMMPDSMSGCFTWRFLLCCVASVPGW